MSELDAILKEFTVECRENLDQLERDLIALESGASSTDVLASIFRTVHTIKGGAGFMELPKLEALAHSGESVLSQLRDGTLVINAAVANGLLALADSMRQMLLDVDRTGSEGDTDCTALVERLGRLEHEAPAEAAAPAETAMADVPGEAVDVLRAPRSPNNIRVNVEILDKLMNLVGELVLARNEIVQFSSAQKQPALLGASQRLSAITTQLQEGIMKTRMQPIDTVWSKLPRVVRDSAEYCGKRVRLEMEGKDTELDRTLIEAIQDPLTHVVRNCIDHGLEAPDTRVAAGKPAEGRLSLRSFHEGGQVTVEVSDDGAGIDVAAIARKAIDRSLLTPEQARGMSEQDLVNLIFLPGLSTAAKVTSMSGRGVGMDVVKTNIERIGGRVTLHSQAGRGTTLTMRIPLTLAIMTALVVTSDDESYALPQVNVLELVRLEAKHVPQRIEIIGDVAIYRLRGELLPLVWLNAELTAGHHAGSAGRLTQGDTVHIVVLQADNVRFGLVVDDVKDTQEIVVKPLGRHVRGIPLFAGATILGDGRVMLILDVPGLAVKTHLLSDVRDRSSSLHEDTLDPESGSRGVALLLVAGLDGTRMAIPLSQITRLESFDRASFEWADDQQVVQYFGDILPLAALASLRSGHRTATQPSSAASQGAVDVLVHGTGDRRIGVIVDSILDTIEQSLDDVRAPAKPGVIGSIVLAGRVTDVIDLDALCAASGAVALVAREPAGASA